MENWIWRHLQAHQPASFISSEDSEPSIWNDDGFGKEEEKALRF